MAPVEELLRAAVIAAIDGNLERAEESLRKIDFVLLATERSRAMEVIWGSNSTIKRVSLPHPNTRRTSPRVSDIRATFQRDRFTCRYAHCQRRTVYVPILRQLSRIFPNTVIYRSNWRPLKDHILYWTWSTTIDHIVPFPFGGTSGPENLVTTCYQCNDLKNYLPLENLGWTLTGPAKSDWDGLSGYLPGLASIKGGEPKGNAAVANAPVVTQHAPEPNDLRIGNLIRAQLPEKQTIRPYRIDALSASEMTLTEMWRRASDSVWVASKNHQTFLVANLRRVSIVRTDAPTEGSIDTKL